MLAAIFCFRGVQVGKEVAKAAQGQILHGFFSANGKAMGLQGLHKEGFVFLPSLSLRATLCQA